MASDRDAFEAAVKKAHSYAWEKRWMKAIEQYELATAEFPEDLTARSGLAFAYLKGERLREALREYRKVCELKPDDPGPRLKIAQILEQLGRASDAAEAWLSLAGVYVQLKDLGRAEDAWREATRLQPANKQAHLELGEAYAHKASRVEAAKEFLSAARLCYDEGDLQEAAGHCQRVLSLDSGNRAARTLLERVASEAETDIATSSLVSWREELGPVDEAVHSALAVLAEALLSDAELVPRLESVDGGEQTEGAACTASGDVGALLGKAVDCQCRGIVQDALVLYQDAVERGVALPEIVFSMGLLNKALSRFDEAVELLRRCQEVREYRLASQLGLAQCYWAQGKTDEAMDQFLEALKTIDLEMLGHDRAEDVAQAYENVAASAWGKEDGRRAELLVHSITALLSGSGWKRRIKEARHKLDSLAEDGVVPVLPEVLEIPGGDEVADLMVRSREYLEQGMPFIALEECYRAIRLAPTYLPLHMRLAEVFARQGKAEEAVSKYAAVADAYLMRDSPGRAMDVYRRALVAAPMAIFLREKLIDLLIGQDEIELALSEYVALGESYYRLARVDTALQSYEQALELVRAEGVNSDWQARILHRVADLHMQRVHWKEALATYEQILQLSPEDEQARFRLVELRYKLGQQERALADVDEFIVHYGKRKEFRKIVGTLKELVTSNPQDISLRSRLSRIYLELGMKEEAIAELDTLGELQLEAGHRREAMETLRAIISLEPDEKAGYTQLLRELGDSSAPA
jgi:tetratricopeptide (TPR) repeat protein